MSILSFKNHIWVKIVAAILVVTFVNQDILWAQDAVTPVSKPTSSSENPQSIDNKAFFRPNNVNASINIPKSLADIRESWSHDERSTINDERKTIINIQDAHAYLGAQESISSILDTLVKNYDIKVVAVEGTSGYIDTSLLKTFPDAKVRDNTARNLMKEGRMSAGEFFSITSEKPIALYGIEEDELYKRNVEELRSVCEKAETVGADIEGTTRLLKNMAARLYSEDLKALDGNVSLYKDGKIPFKHLWSVLSPIAAKAGMDLEPYKDLKKLAFLTHQEKSIDFEKANDERKAIISAITDRLTKNELEVFVSSIMEFKKGGISSGDFHAYLKSTAEKNGVDPYRFSSFCKYAEYISEYEKIDIPSIPNQLRDYSAAIKNKLYRNDDEKALDLCMRFMEYAGGLFSLQLGNDEFSELIKISRSLNPAAFTAILEKVSRKTGLGIEDPASIKNIFDALPAAISFYTTAEERNRVMVENTIRRMNSEGARAACLITGGYHTSGLTGLLRDRRCSYLVMLPKFDPSKGERPYIAILTNKKKPYEKLLKTGQYHIATRAYFAQDPSKTEEEKFDSYSGDFTRALYEAAKDIRDEKAKAEELNRLVGLWSKNYREFYKAFKEEHGNRPVEGFTPKSPAFVDRALRSLLAYSRSTEKIWPQFRKEQFGVKPIAPGKSRVIYVTAEMRRVAQAGGLGDVSLELPEYLNSNGNEVAVITPGYDVKAGEDLNINLEVWLRGESVTLGVRRTYLNGTWAYLLTNPKYFNESGPYGGGDDAMLDRFTLLSAGALELIKSLEIKPDVVNANDWHTALVPFYMRNLPEYAEYFHDVAANLTIHNLTYKGLFGTDKTNTFAAGRPDIITSHSDAFRYEGGVSLLKAGVIFSDTVNTVGHSYLMETLDAKVAGDFADILRERFQAGSYFSILNGISHSEWDPAVPAGIDAKDVFGAGTSAAGKRNNKLRYQRASGLAEGNDKFVIGFVGRYDYIKGIDLIISDIDRMMSELGQDVELVMLGPDVGGYGQRLGELSMKYAGRIHIRTEFGEPRTVFAASDAVIIPSRYGTEPCNLVQMEAMRYGAVPIVFKTGGLSDVITPFNPMTGEGNGFNFDEYSPEAMYDAIASAYMLFKRNRGVWGKLVSNCMLFDSTWREAGNRYEELYRKSSKIAKRPRTKLAEYSIEELCALYPNIKGGGLNREHVKRVSAYAVMVAEDLGLKKELVDILGRVGIVHDVSCANEAMLTAREDKELNQSILRRYGFASQPRKEDALEQLRAFIAERPELSRYVVPDDDKYYVSIARVVAAASAMDGETLDAWQIEWITSDISHERHSLDVLKNLGFEINPLEEFLISNHLFYPAGMEEYEEAASKSGITPEEAKLMLSVLIVCDVFENGNNAERLHYQRGIEYQSLMSTFNYIKSKEGLDPRAISALRAILAGEERRMMELMLESRPKRSSDALRPGEMEFLKPRSYHGERPAQEISANGERLALLIKSDNFYEGTPDPRIGLEVRILKEGEEFETTGDAPLQEVILVKEGFLKIDIYENGKKQETITLGKGDTATIFGKYHVIANTDSKICRVIQKPDLDVVRSPDDSVVPLNIQGESVPKVVNGESGNQLALVLKAKINSEKYALITNPGFPIGIGFKSPKSGAPAATPHVNSPIENPLPELFVVQEGLVKCKVYTKEGVLVRDVVLEAGDMILNLAGHSIEFPSDSKVIEIILGPYPGFDKAKTHIVDMDSLPSAEKSSALRHISEYPIEALLELFSPSPLSGGENINKSHNRRVARLAVSVARELGIREELVDLIGRVSAIHDLGGLAATVEEVASGAVKGNIAMIEKYGIRVHTPKEEMVADMKSLLANRPELERYLLPADPDFEKYYISAGRLVAAAYALDGKPLPPGKAEELVSELSHERYSVDRLAKLGISLTPAEKFIIDNHFFYPKSFAALDSIAATSGMSTGEMKLLLDILILCDVFENGNNAGRLLALRNIDYQPISRTLELFGTFFGGKGLDDRPLSAMKALLAKRDPGVISIIKEGRPDGSSDAVRPDEFDFLQAGSVSSESEEQPSPINISVIKWLVIAESFVTGSGLITFAVQLPGYWHLLFGFISGLGLAYTAIHFITALEIKRAFASSHVSTFGPNGNERDIARYNGTSEKIEYLWYNISDSSDVTYDPSAKPEAYRRVYDNIPHNSLSGRIARYFIERHEVSHAAGYREPAAYYMPGIGSGAVFRAKSDEFIGEVMQALYTGSPMSNLELLAKAESDRRRLFALAERLKQSIGEFPSVITKARAYLLIGHIYSRYSWFGVGARIENNYTDLAINTIKSAIKRNIGISREALKIPEDLKDKEVIVSSPVRIDLSHGGASDLFAITFDRGGRAVNMAFDLDGETPIKVKVRRLEERVISITSKDLDIKHVVDSVQEIFDYEDKKDPLRLFKAAFIVSGIIDMSETRPLSEILESLGGGIELEVEVNVPRGSGLGVSSILDACVLEGLYRISGQNKSKDEVLNATLFLEHILNIGGGWQDPVGGIFGGVKLVSSKPGAPHPVVEPIAVSDEFVRKLQERVVLYYVGKSHFAGDILRKIVIDYITHNRVESESRERLVGMDDAVSEAIRSGDIDKLGRLVGEFWKEWKILNPEASNSYIEGIFQSVSDLAAGGKLCGAGGGGFALFIAKEGKKKELEDRLSRLDPDNKTARLVSGTINMAGMKVEVNPYQPANLYAPETAHFQALIDEAKIGGKYHCQNGFYIKADQGELYYSSSDIAAAIDYIKTARGMRTLDIGFSRTDKDVPVRFKAEVDQEILDILGSDQYRIDLEKLIEEAIKTRGPDDLRALEGRTISIALVERSQSIFEDHIKNNFIGINRILFEEVAPNMPKELFAIILSAGITHELSHEVGDMHEGAITRKDIDLVLACASRKTIDIQPAVSALERVVKENGLFMRGLRRVTGATADSIGIAEPAAVIKGSSNVVANSEEMLARLRRIAKNIAVIEDPELAAFKKELDAALADSAEIKINTYLALMSRYYKYMDGDERQKMVRRSLGLGKSERIAYFSLEYGLSQWLNIYSGGLGILSGDTLWAANDRYPKNTFVAMGLAYRTGFFEQHIVTEEDHLSGQYADLPVGSQVQYYRDIPFEKYGDIAKDKNGKDIVIKVESTPGKFIYAKIWHIRVGRVDLYLLDTDIPENDDQSLNPEPNARKLTHNLYARGRDHMGNILPKDLDYWRFMQELLLGVGGVRALQAMGHKIAVLHMNEGHSALSGIELIRQELEARAAKIGLGLEDLNVQIREGKVERKVLMEAGITFTAAREAVKERMAFTSHTPIPDGNEEFDIGMFRRFFENYSGMNGMDIEDILGISSYESEVYGKYMVNLSKLALNLSRYANGVSEKHGEVSRRLYKDDTIDYITNAVHRRFWQSPELQSILAESLTRTKRDGAIPQDRRLSELSEAELKTLLGSIDNEALRQVLDRSRERAVEHLKESRGVELDKDAFVVVIARRAAPYKRSDLILPKLDALMEEAKRLGVKVQVVFAGKAHPADDRGQLIIRQINEFISRYPGTAFFVENYNISVARDLTRIASVWLNNPIPPLEASGTSGMKAGLNGVVSLSTPDGWVLESEGAVEALEGGEPLSAPGAAVIFKESDIGDTKERDDQTRENMYSALLGLMKEFAGDKDKWTSRSKNVIYDVMAHFTMERFIREYEEKAYVPSIEAYQTKAATMAVPIGSPRRISKEDFIKRYEGDYSYSNGIFYKREQAVPTAFYGLLKGTEVLLPKSIVQRIRAFLANFIPLLRDKPVQIEVVNNLGTNCVKYIDDNGNVYIVFDRDFVETLSEHEYDHREVVLHILAERLAHELAHSNAALTREELKAEEARIILEVDLPLHRKTLANKELQSRIDRFFSEAKRSLQAEGREMFHSGRYYSRSEKAVLGHLASLPPDKAKAAAEWFVNRFYDGSDIQNNLMAIPIQDIWQREAIVQSDFKQMLADQRRDIMTTELRRLFRKVPRNFVGDFIKSMPGEHILAAAPKRLVRECGLAYRMSRQFMVEALENDHIFTVYNPPDADHTEVMIFGKESSRLIHDTTEVLNRMADEGVLVHPISNWSYAAGGMGITVFELKNISSLGPEDDKARGVALNESQTEMLKDLCRSLYPDKNRYIDSEELLNSDPSMLAELDRLASHLESLTPEEIEIPSVKGDEVLFLTVQRSVSFLDCTKMADEDMWTEHDTIRQRKTKIAEQSERMRRAIDNIVPGLGLSGDSLRELGESTEKAFKALEERGKNFIFTFDISIKPYLDRLRKNRKNKDAGKIEGLLASLRDIEDAASGLTDDRVEREIAVLDRTIQAMKINAARLVDEANTEEAKSVALNTISFLSDPILLDEVRGFVRSEKRRSYVKLLDKAREMWPIVQTFMGNIADIKKERISEAEKSVKLKVYEGLVDAYMALMELVRHMHNADRPLPELDGVMDIEISQAEEAFSDALVYLGRNERDSIKDFIDGLPEKIVLSLAYGGPNASELVYRFAQEYSAADPSLAGTLNKFAALFAIAMDGRMVSSIDQEDEATTIYVTDAMDQIHAFKFVDKNPDIAAIATETGNSRSHWVITLEDMLMEDMREPIMVIPGVPDLRNLETGDLIVIDASRRRIVRNPQSNPAVMRYYEERRREREILKEIYREHSSEESKTLDGEKITFLSDIPRIEPDAALVKGYGAAGVGLIRMENMYMRKVEPTEDEIYAQALKAADSVEGPVTFRTLDMEKDKLKDMVSIADAVGFTVDGEGGRRSYVTSERPVLYGVPFYFEDIKGREIIRIQLRALLRASASSKKKNIRITIPMVENEDQASMLKDLVSKIKSELVDEGLAKSDLDKVRFGAMIETPAACAAVPEILREGLFSYISIGTNDLSKRSFSDAYERDDERLEKIYHVLFPAFVRNVRNAFNGVNDYNRHAPPASRAEVCICGEWANSRKFLFYIISLLDTFKLVEVSMVVKSHKVGELKEYLRYTTLRECADEVMSGEINDGLSMISDGVGAQIRLARDVEGRKAEMILEEAAGSLPTWRKAIKNALSHGIFIMPLHGGADKLIIAPEAILAFLSVAFFVWASFVIFRNLYYSHKVESLRAEVMNEYNDLAFNPKTGRSRTADIITALSDPHRIPHKYSLPVIKDIILHARPGRIMQSKTSRLPVNVYALFATYQHMDLSPQGSIEMLKEIVYDKEASSTKVRYNGEQNSISGLTLSYISNQIVDAERINLAKYFIPFLQDVALNPLSLGRELTFHDTRYTLSGLADRLLEHIEEEAQLPRSREMAQKALEEIQRKMPGRADIVIGIASGTIAGEGMDGIRNFIDSTFPLLRVSLVEIETNSPEDPKLSDLAYKMRARRGVVLDLPYGLAIPALREYLMSTERDVNPPDEGYIYSMDPSSLRYMTVEGMVDIVKSLAATIPAVSPADIESVRASLEALKPAIAARTIANTREFAHTESAFLNSFIIGDRTKAVSITTQGVLDAEMMYALRDKIAGRQKRQGVSSKDDDPVKEIVLITDPELASDKAKVARYIDTLGLTPYVTAVTKEELHGVVSGLRASGIKHIGIRAREGEIEDYEEILKEVSIDAVKLELAGPVDTNSYEVLLELFAQSGYWRNIPYLTKDEEKNIFKYLPENLPKNYEEEIRMHREFVKLILRAA